MVLSPSELGCVCFDYGRRLCVTFGPERFGNFERVDIEVLPPGDFIAGLMQLPMMAAAERHRKFIADFET